MKYHDLKIGIIGEGSVGSTLAVELISNGYDVEIVTHKKGICINGSKAYQILGDFGDKSYLVPIVDSMSDFSSKKDFIIIATKSFDAVDLLEEAQNYLSPVGKIVTIQNVFYLDKVNELIPTEKSIFMFLDIFIAKHPQGRFVVDSGGITLGICNKEAFDMMQVLSHILQSSTEVHITHNILGFLISRNILNATISALGAMSGLSLGKIFQTFNGKFLFKRLIEEGYKTLCNLNIEILPYNDRLDYAKFTSDTLRGRIYSSKLINILRKNNPNVRSSILVDLENGNKTEIQYLIGSFIRYGEKTGQDTPYIKAVYEMLTEIESGVRRIDPASFYDPKLTSIKYKRRFV